MDGKEMIAFVYVIKYASLLWLHVFVCEYFCFCFFIENRIELNKVNE